MIIARTTADLEAAPMYAVVRGALELQAVAKHWETFSVDPPDEEVLDEAGIEVSHITGGVFTPMLDDDFPEERERGLDDLDACLSYLAAPRHRLVKLPDEPGSPYWRLYVRTAAESRP